MNMNMNMNMGRNPQPPQPTQGNDWRSTISIDVRQKLVSKIVDTLKEMCPADQPQDQTRVQTLAQKFEVNVYQKAADSQEYFRLIANKMYQLKKKTQNPTQQQPGSTQSASSSNGIHSAASNQPTPTIQLSSASQNLPNPSPLHTYNPSVTLASNNNLVNTSHTNLTDNNLYRNLPKYNTNPTSLPTTMMNNTNNTNINSTLPTTTTITVGLQNPTVGNQQDPMIVEKYWQKLGTLKQYIPQLQGLIEQIKKLIAKTSMAADPAGKGQIASLQSVLKRMLVINAVLQTNRSDSPQKFPIKLENLGMYEDNIVKWLAKMKSSQAASSASLSQADKSTMNQPTNLQNKPLLSAASSQMIPGSNSTPLIVLDPSPQSSSLQQQQQQLHLKQQQQLQHQKQLQLQAQQQKIGQQTAQLQQLRQQQNHLQLLQNQNSNQNSNQNLQKINLPLNLQGVSSVSHNTDNSEEKPKLLNITQQQQQQQQTQLSASLSSRALASRPGLPQQQPQNTAVNRLIKTVNQLTPQEIQEASGHFKEVLQLFALGPSAPGSSSYLSSLNSASASSLPTFASQKSSNLNMFNHASKNNDLVADSDTCSSAPMLLDGDTSKLGMGRFWFTGGDEVEDEDLPGRCDWDWGLSYVSREVPLEKVGQKRKR